MKRLNFRIIHQKVSEEEKKQRDLYLKKLSNGTLQGPPVGYPSIDKSWLKYYDDESIGSWVSSGSRRRS